MKTHINTLEMGINTLDPKTDYIKFEGDNSMLFWRVSGNILNPKAEIIIPETHQAIYIKDGVTQNILDGGRYPVFDVKKGLFGSKKKEVDVDIIFVSKTCKLVVKWGTKTPLKSRDTLTEIPVTIRAYGEFEVQISNPRKFYEVLVGADKSFTIEILKTRLSTRMLSYVEPVIAKFMKEEHISYVDVSENKKKMSDSVLPEISALFDNEYGLKVFSFTIADLTIADEEIEAIEDELTARRKELKDKKDAKEIADELERIADKEWERELYLRNLQQADRDKYYEVLKILGWPNGKPNKGSAFCPNCGEAITPGMKFCPGCGKALPGGKKHCQKCGAECDSAAAFCSNCGNKF